jgi:S1-C subfamily serine protease
MTNIHVIEGANSIEIVLTSGQTYMDSIDSIYEHDFLDIAIFKMETSRSDFPAADIGFSSDIMVGQQVVAVGYPYAFDLGYPITFTYGIVSAVRNIEGDEYIQFDPAANPGNSGGPIVNLDGEVVRIVTLGLYKGQNFAIP